ncbi:hypothetical protein HK097_000218, partial [Rhizophlyctis rosea]
MLSAELALNESLDPRPPSLPSDHVTKNDDLHPVPSKPVRKAPPPVPIKPPTLAGRKIRQRARLSTATFQSVTPSGESRASTYDYFSHGWSGRRSSTPGEKTFSEVDAEEERRGRRSVTEEGLSNASPLHAAFSINTDNVDPNIMKPAMARLAEIRRESLAFPHTAGPVIPVSPNSPLDLPTPTPPPLPHMPLDSPTESEQTIHR